MDTKIKLFSLYFIECKMMLLTIQCIDNLFLNRTVLIKNAYSAYVENFFLKKCCSHEHGKILSSSADLLTVELWLFPSVVKLHI